jgi:hypothetical protein
VPYALRVREARDEQRRLQAKEYDQVANPGGSASVSLDLGEPVPEHNQVEVALSGRGYGRPLRLEGSADGKSWSKLLDGVYVVQMEIAGRMVDQRRFTYPPSRLRHLRVQVRPDRVLENDRPVITAVGVFHSVHVPGEDVTLAADVQPREPVRGAGAPGSAWRIDLGEENVPCRKLTLEVSDDDFSRPYFLERLPSPDPTRAAYEQPPPEVVASGELRRQNGQPAALEIDLSREVQTRWLRLTVTDNRNPPLNLAGARATAAAREAVFAPPAGGGPLRLYFGNPRAQEPRYDFAAGLPARLDPPPARAELGPVEVNPDYRPPPKPWTERWPYLVDAVLAGASAVLVGILLVLARSAIRRHDAARQPAA